MNIENYFISIEKRFQNIATYVEIDNRNYNTFSAEISLIFMAACSEFEVIAKEVCKKLSTEFSKISHPNIKNIEKVLINNIRNEVCSSVEITRYNVKIEPFAKWK